MKYLITFSVLFLLLTQYCLSNVWEVPGVCPTIQAGLDSCQTGDTVLVASGTYYENLVWPATQGIYLMSESGSNFTTIDGGGTDRVIYIYTGVDATTVIEGFTIQNGYAVHGGGILCSQNSSPKITGNVFTNNVADSAGGAINCTYNSSPIIVNNTVEYNTAGWAGGIFCSYNSSPNIVGNTLIGNDCTSFTGDIFAWWGCSPTIDSNQIYGNHSSSSVSLVGGYSNVRYNRITNPIGTGISLWSDYSTIMYNLIYSNGVDGIFCQEGSFPTINYNDIIDNTGYGVNNDDPAITVNAENNWWGDASGPSGAGPGSGDPVSLYVDYDPWLTQSVYPDTLLVPSIYATIQEAIDAAIDGYVVLVAEGTYYENINYKGKAITIASHFLVNGDTSHISNTVIDGSQPTNPDNGSVVSFVSGEDTTSVLCGFTITGGTGTYYAPYDDVSGGGINLFLSGAKICNNIIEYNSVSYNNYSHGGGICAYVNGISVIIENNIIRNNTTNANTGTTGGGISLWNADYARVVNNKIIDNIATCSFRAWGGGINCNGTSNELTISNNLIKGNECITNDRGGGGIAIYHGTSVVNNNLIVGNSAFGGGGILLELGTNSSSPSGNNNPGRGSVQNNGLNSNQYISKVTQFETVLENNTIINNTATYGGGVRSVGYNPEMINCILWGNTAPTGPQIFGSAIVVYSDVEGGWAGEGNIDANPLFVDATNGNYQLQDNISPCLQTGIDSIDIGGTMYYCPPFCYYGIPRPSPAGTMPDMGACENENPVGVENDLTLIPEEYSLSQNYPNPFNPTTTIVYGLRERTNVELKLYDVLGSEIEIFVSGEQDAGYYEIEFNAGSLASGIYLCRLQTSSFVETKKMVLMK